MTDTIAPARPVSNTPPASPAAAHPDQLSDTQRYGWTIAAIITLSSGVLAWGAATQWAWVVLPVLGIETFCIVSVINIWVRRQYSMRWQAGLFLAAVVAMGLIAAYAVIGNPGYGTDEMAFDQYAAQLMLHGHNPYTHSMAPSFDTFHVPEIFRSFKLDGGVVSQMSYPSLSFLIYVPIMLLGVHAQAAVIMDVLGWAVTALLVFRLLPRNSRWVAIPLMLSTLYVSYAYGGVVDSIYLPFLILAVWRWDRYGDPDEKSAARWIGPVALGLACAVKQTPWFVAPFLLIGIFVEARHHRAHPYKTVACYAGTAAGVALALNLPWIVANPVAWFKDIMVPITAPMIPAGQGLVDLTTRLGLGGDLSFYKYLAVIALVLALLAWVVFYRQLKRAWMLLIPLLFLWPARSFSSYLVMLLPAMLVAAVTVNGSSFQLSARLRRWATIAIAAIGVAMGLCVMGALTIKGPISLRVVSTSSTGELQTVDFINVVVTNSSSQPLAPHYDVNSGDYASSFWTVISGPKTLPPHSSARLTLEAPNTASMPSLLSPFQVDAYTATPASIAVSSHRVPTAIGTSIFPMSVAGTIKAGHEITLTVQLTSRIGNPIHRSGVPVQIGQVIYGPHSLIPAEASINGASEGASPVTAYTNSQGVATFHITDRQPQPLPIFMQAWLQGSHNNSTGYSNIVTIQFGQ